MKSNTLNIVICGIFALTLTNSCISYSTKNNNQNKMVTEQNFTNKTRIPIFPGCNSNENTENCLQNSVGDLILEEANRRNLILKNDTIKVGFRVDVDGTTKILDNETKNSSLKAVVHEVLSNLPIIEPAYSTKLKEYVSSGYSYFILIKDNTITNRL